MGNNSYVGIDTIPPVVFNCPSDTRQSAELGNLQVAVYWVEPSAVDLLGTVILEEATHRPGEIFPVDSSTDVSYIFVDNSENAAYCNFTLTVFTGTCFNYKFLQPAIQPILSICPDVDQE